MHTILITSVGSGIGQAIVDSLLLYDSNLRLLGADMSPWAAGLYAADRAFLVPPCDDPAYISVLLDICKREKVDLLYPGNDWELAVLAQNREHFFDSGTQVVVGTLAAVEVVRNKRKSYEFFSGMGLPFVKTMTLAEFSTADMRWPVIVKPLGGSGSVGTEVIFARDQAEKYQSSNGNYIFQEYLVPVALGCSREELTREQLMPGGILRQEQEVSVQFLVSKTGVIIDNYISINTLKQGVPVHITPYIDQEVEEVCTRMVQALVDMGLRGPINLQGRITEDGPVFYELNHRFTGITAVRARMGFNECAAIYEDFCLSLPLAEVKAKLKTNYELLCSRFWTDMLVPRKRYEELGSKKTISRG